MPSRGIRTRAARPSDAAALAAMIRELADHEGATGELAFSVEQLERALTADRPRLHAILAEDSSGPIGFVTYTIDFAIWTGADVVRVDDVFVRDHARRRGTGRLLMTRIAELAIAGGMSARWEIEPVNLAAQRFYEGLGVTIRDKIVARWTLHSMRRLLDLNRPSSDGRSSS
jgi:GNAT superfamily N-acetyltransferase